MHPRESYQKVINKWLNDKSLTENTKNILNRGMWCCFNPTETYRGIMISGINPSYDEERPEEPLDCTFEQVKDEKGRNYWETKKQMVCGLNIPTSYIDLFPLRMTKQDSFMKDSIVPLELKAELLRITQERIEEIHPKLIINPNMLSRVYWGVIEEYPWMGYNMRRIDNPISKGELYIIEGKLNKTGVILPNMDTCLKGTYFLQYKYHGNGVLAKEEYLTSKDISILWNHINK